MPALHVRRAAGAALLCLATLIGASCSDSNNEDGRDCCNCLSDHACWDFQKCPSNVDCVCTLAHTQCSHDPPCVAIGEDCRKKWCRECDGLFTN